MITNIKNVMRKARKYLESAAAEPRDEAARALLKDFDNAIIGGPRDVVYVAVDSERDYQDAQRGNAKRHVGQPEMTPGEYILCMEKCLADAREAWYRPDGGTSCLPFVRKVTALGVACMEKHGAPPR